ncbi:tyrosine-type recombinase/integrase [Bacteroides faecichinchillae]|uniref:tyrosine-type recombinase/integrase n=1 Tax=Bacteroides faecichinchillae TaxID=871325 RepID=UPI0023B89660|nr:tyrosine-type recombinase/integrase [Bacteroides faecichinchillae]
MAAGTQGLCARRPCFRRPSQCRQSLYQPQELADKAGVKKNVTFHTARHSCAVLLLTLGADIYTVSKILGHRSVRATQVYAKIVDKKKDDAIALVDNAF